MCRALSQNPYGLGTDKFDSKEVEESLCMIDE